MLMSITNEISLSGTFSYKQINQAINVYEFWGILWNLFVYWLIDWLIDWIEFYAVLAIFQPYNTFRLQGIMSRLIISIAFLPQLPSIQLKTIKLLTINNRAHCSCDFLDPHWSLDQCSWSTAFKNFCDEHRFQIVILGHINFGVHEYI